MALRCTGDQEREGEAAGGLVDVVQGGDRARLAQQVADIVANRGNAAWQRAKSGMDDAVADAQDKGRDAVDAMREVSDQFVEAIDESIKSRPYTTLAMALGLGFLFGAMWRR